LVHGDTLEVKYQDSDNLVFTLDYLIDFDDGTKKYERIVDISKVTSLTVGTSADCNISIGGAYVKNDRLVLSKKGDKLALNIQNTTYGVYINGRRAAVKDVIKNGDFLSVSDYLFYFKDNKIWTQIRPDLTVNALPYSDQPIPALYPKFNRNTRIKTVVCDEKIEILDPPAKPQKPKNNIVTRLLPSLGMLLAAGVMAYFGGAMIIMSAISGTMAIITNSRTPMDPEIPAPTSMHRWLRSGRPAPEFCATIAAMAPKKAPAGIIAMLKILSSTPAAAVAT